jgi:hypothetical protein
MHIKKIVKKRMICSHCRGYMVRAKEFDLPNGYFEFYCINCGKRIWVDPKTLEKPIYLN